MAKIKLPSNVEAERAVLGAILLNDSIALSTIASLKESDFSGDDPRNVLIFKAMKILDDHSHPIDVEIVQDQLINMQVLSDAGGAEYLMELINSVIDFKNIDYYVNLLRNQAVFRSFLTKISKIQKDYADGEVKDISEFMAVNTQALSDIASQRQVANFQSAYNVTETIRSTIQKELRSNNNGITGIDTGYLALNAYTHGWQPGNLIILAARPGMGKTALMLNFALKATENTGRTVAVFSCEMDNNSIMKRILASESLVDIGRLSSGNLTRRELDKLDSALTRIGQTKLYFDDTPNQALGDIVAKAHKLKNDNPDLCMIFVDYINIIDVQGKYDSRTLEIGAITKTLKQLARTLGVPVMALAQVSREADKSDNHTPSLANLKESGNIEQDADLVLMIYRSNYYKKQGLEVKEKNSQYAQQLKETVENQNGNGGDANDKHEIVDVNVAKNRNGQQGKFHLMFTGANQRFDNVDSEREQYQQFMASGHQEPQE